MTQYQVALAFEDGVTRFVTCTDDQTVADASYRARINIPLDCRDGACGTCKAFCESGEFDAGTYIEDALSADEFEQGYVLPCVMKPRSDLVLKIASTSEVAKTQAATYVGEITEFTRLSPSTVSFAIEIPNRDELAFLPGQYVNIAVPGTDESRSYSFSNAPDDKSLTFLVKLTRGGVMSTYLDERAKVGDQLTFTGPNGSFFLREGQGPALLIAGGTGLAPILSILRKMRSGGGRPMHLIYGVNTDDDAVELSTLEKPRRRTGKPDLELLRRGQGQLGGAQGFRHRPHRTRASLRRRRVRLPVRPAADGRGSPQAHRCRRCGAGRLLLREVCAVGHRCRRCSRRGARRTRSTRP